MKLPEHQRNVMTFVEQCAQRTLVTKSLADRLGLQVESPEKACLLGFGAKRPVNTIFNIVKVPLGIPFSNKEVQVDAYVVDKLNPVHMLGIAKLAKKIQGKGIQLADWRLINSKSDIIELDLLIGSDFFLEDDQSL